MKISKKYEVTTDYDINYKPLSELTDTTHFKNGSDLFVIEGTTKKVTQGQFNSSYTEKFTNVVTSQELKEIMDSPDKIKNFNRFENNINIFLAKSEFLEFSTKYGFRNPEGLQKREFGKNLPKEELKTTSDHLISDSFLSDAQKPGFTFVQNIPNNKDRRMYNDSKGEIFCEPFIMDYIQAKLNNETYKLDDLVDHLKARDDIAFIVKKEREEKLLKCPLKDNDPELSSIIQDIPYYNADEERSEFINVVYYPKSKDAQKILDFKSHAKSDYIDVSYFVVKEILGAKAFTVLSPEPIKEPAATKRKYKR